MLRAIYEEYAKISKNDIETAIKKETSGDLEKAYLAIGKGVILKYKPYVYDIDDLYLM